MPRMLPRLCILAVLSASPVLASAAATPAPAYSLDVRVERTGKARSQRMHPASSQDPVNVLRHVSSRDPSSTASSMADVWQAQFYTSTRDVPRSFDPFGIATALLGKTHEPVEGSTENGLRVRYNLAPQDDGVVKVWSEATFTEPTLANLSEDEDVPYRTASACVDKNLCFPMDVGTDALVQVDQTMKPGVDLILDTNDSEGPLRFVYHLERLDSPIHR